MKKICYIMIDQGSLQYFFCCCDSFLHAPHARIMHGHRKREGGGGAGLRSTTHAKVICITLIDVSHWFQVEERGNRCRGGGVQFVPRDGVCVLCAGNFQKKSATFVPQHVMYYNAQHNKHHHVCCFGY